MRFRQVIGTAFFALAMGVPSLAAAYTTFDLRGYGGLEWSHDFSADGIGLTVTAATFSDEGVVGDPAKVGQYSNGLGVTNFVDRNWWGGYSDSHFVDGHGANDLLIFAFDHAISPYSVTFSYGDRNDDFHFFFEDSGDTDLELEAGNIDLPGRRFYSTYVFSAGLIGDTLGFGADHWSDEFKVKKIKVEKVAPIPLPAPVALLGVAVAGLLFGGRALTGRQGT